MQMSSRNMTWVALTGLVLGGLGAGARADEPAATPGQNPIAIETSAASTAPPAAKPDTPTQLSEVVVTATKRREGTRSIPGGVSAITREQLDQTGASNLSEYLSLSPGVNYDNSIPGYSVVTIRGVSSDTVPGLAQTAVGMYYDDIPLTDPGAPLVVPDIDAFDAARVEVLRGPQGALYGSASLGGAVNYIPDAPDPKQTELSLFGSGSHTTDSAWGGAGKLMLNAPLFGNQAALRLVGYDIEQPGYIDNIGTGTRDSNSSKTRGGRAMFAWTPSAGQTLKLSALYQRTTVADTPYINPALPGLEKNTSFLEPIGNDLWLADLHYQLDTRFAAIQLIGGYQEKGMSLLEDGGAQENLQATGIHLPLTQTGHVRGYSAELRLVSPASETFNWLAGLSYVYHREDFVLGLDAQTLADLTGFLGLLGLNLPPPLNSVTTLFDQSADIRAPEEALFFEASYRPFRAFKLTAGGRAYRNQITSFTDSRGLLVIPSGSLEVQARNAQKAEGFNPRISLSYDVTRGAMLYATYSKGYRLGGPNLAPSTPLTPGPAFYNPDQVRNVEVGAKTRWWHGRLTADIAAYDIGWTDIPLSVQQSGLFKYLENAGTARSKGIEAALATRPLSFLTVRSAVSYGDARLKEAFDPHNGRPAAPAGSRLPGAPEWTVTNTLAGEWEWGNHEPTVVLLHRYVGGSPSNISWLNIPTGNYNLLDARAGLKLWGVGVTAFGKNLTNKRGITALSNLAETGGDTLQVEYLTPPRTLGLELSYSFAQ